MLPFNFFALCREGILHDKGEEQKNSENRKNTSIHH